MLNESITGSPQEFNKSIQNKRLHRKNKRKRLDNESNYDEHKTFRITDLYTLEDEEKFNGGKPVDKMQHYGANYDPFAEQQCLAIADRLYCSSTSQLQQQKIVDIKLLQGFRTCQHLELEESEHKDCMLVDNELSEKRILPETEMQFGITETELISFCDEAIAEQKVNMSDIDFRLPIAKTPQKSIVEQILDDFCSSPTPKNELTSIAIAAANASPRFRFRHKELRTYSREYKKLTRRNLNAIVHAMPSHITDDCLSNCSSELSMQEDFTQSLPTGVDVDLNKTQRLCENLINLSTYFTQNAEEKSTMSTNKPKIHASAFNEKVAVSMSEETKACSQLLTQIINLHDKYFSNRKKDFWQSSEDFSGFDENEYVGNDVCNNDSKPKEQCIDLPATGADSANTTFLVVPLENKHGLCNITNEILKDEVSADITLADNRQVQLNVMSETNANLDEWHNDCDFFANFHTQNAAVPCAKVNLSIKHDNDFKTTKIANDAKKRAGLEVVPQTKKGLRQSNNTKEEIVLSQDQDADWNMDCDFFANIQTQQLIEHKCPSEIKQILSNKDTKQFMCHKTTSLNVINPSQDSQKNGVKNIDIFQDRKNQIENAKLKEKYYDERPSTSKVALQKAKYLEHNIRLLSEIDSNEDFNQGEEKSQNFIGFRTASSKSISISAEAKQRAANMLKDITEKPMESNADLIKAIPDKKFNTKLNENNTAASTIIVSGKQMAEFADEWQDMQLSEWPLADYDVKPTTNKQQPKVNELSSDYERTTIKGRTALTLNNNPPLSIESVKTDQQKATKTNFIDRQEKSFHNNFTLNELTDTAFIGFQTASKKSIHISKAAQKKAADILNDLPPLAETGNIADEEASNKPANHYNQSSRDQNQNQVLLQKATDNEEFIGFRTASRKSITISKVAEERAANILSKLPPLALEYDINSDKSAKANDIIDSNNSAGFLGFHTSSRHSIALSKEAQKIAAKISNELPFLARKNVVGNNKAVIDSNVDAEFIGFRTASHKSITISKLAQERAANILSKLPPLALEGDINSDKPVNISEINNSNCGELRNSNEGFKKLEENILNELPPLTLKYNKPVIDSTDDGRFIGFRTASRKSIIVSKEAQIKAENILNELPPLSMDAIDIDGKFEKDTNVNKGKGKLQQLTTRNPGTSKAIENNAKRKLEAIQDNPNTSPIKPNAKILCRALTTSSLELTPNFQNKCELGKLKSNLTDLATLSPLTTCTTTSIIARKNLLSLSKRRKSKKSSNACAETADTANENSIQTPIKETKTPQVETPNLNEFYNSITDNTSTPRPTKLQNILKTKQSKSIVGMVDTDFKQIQWDNCNDSHKEVLATPTNRAGNSKSMHSVTEIMNTSATLPPSPQERIARLRVYGDPPPISPIPVFIKSNCRPSGLRRSRTNILSTSHKKSDI